MGMTMKRIIIALLATAAIGVGVASPAAAVSWGDQATQSAREYLASQAFSRSGLIHQLEYEGFSEAEATRGVDAVHANWYVQAVRDAREYLASQSFSRSGLIRQLRYEGFTLRQATYGVNHA